MTLLSSILLGLIQGIAEFLPISSSGHLAIAENLLNMSGASEVPEFFDVLLHLGTLLAVFVAYWGDIYDMVVEFFHGVRDLAHRSTPVPVPPARRMILLIIVGTLPLFAVLPIKDLVEGLANNMYFVGGALIVTGFLLFASDRVRKGRKTERSATMLDVLLVGVAQAIATCPGISRSGMTVAGSLYRRLDRESAASYSFLLSVIAILGGLVITLKDIADGGASAANAANIGALPLIVGFVVAAVSGYFAIRFMLNLLQKRKLRYFSWYVFCLGAFIMLDRAFLHLIF